MLQINHRRATYFLVALLALSNIMFNPAAVAGAYEDLDGTPSGGAMLADTILVRPFMLTSTVVGLAAFIVTLPFSALGGNVGEAGNRLVMEPAKYTFVRPLGDL